MEFYTNNILFKIRQKNKNVAIPTNEIVINNMSHEDIYKYHTMALDNTLSGTSTFLFIVENYKETTSYFLEKFKRITAGGGLVVNEYREILFINRLGKWDLPKGKIEKNEEVKIGALREVKEETGVSANIINHLKDTYHTYKCKHTSKEVFKRTCWYLMKAEKTTLTPQTEENIKSAEWLNETLVDIKVINDTYPSIIDVLKQYEKVECTDNE